MNVEEQLRTERIGKLLLTFSVPSIISLVITAIYNMVDQVFIGQGVGYLGNGATNVIYPLTQVALALGLMIGEGGANYISLHLGAGKRDKVSLAAAAAVAALFGCGIGAALYALWRDGTDTALCAGLWADHFSRHDMECIFHRFHLPGSG